MKDDIKSFDSVQHVTSSHRVYDVMGIHPADKVVGLREALVFSDRRDLVKNVQRLVDTDSVGSCRERMRLCVASMSYNEHAPTPRPAPISPYLDCSCVGLHARNVD